MIKAKTLCFLRLSFIFLAITVAVVTFNFAKSYNNMAKPAMMSESMGNMMINMHLKNTSFIDLFKDSQMKMAASASSHSHHSNTRSLLSSVYQISTFIIIVFVPFIIAGSLFLFIAWL